MILLLYEQSYQTISIVPPFQASVYSLWHVSRPRDEACKPTFQALEY